MKVNVLGTEYSINFFSKLDDPKLNDVDGYMEPYTKKIVIDNMAPVGTPDPLLLERIDLHKIKVLRHEIVHAFLTESGLRDNSQWASDEELVDWIAYQIPKMVKAMKEAECL